MLEKRRVQCALCKIYASAKKNNKASAPKGGEDDPVSKDYKGLNDNVAVKTKKS